MPKSLTEEDRRAYKFPKESALQNYVLKRLRDKKEFPDLMVKKIADRFSSGISDLLLCYKGKFIAIELKIEGNKPTELQKQFLEEVKQSGGVAGVAYTWGEVLDIIYEAKRSTTT